MEKNSFGITINGYFHPRGGWGIFNWNLAQILSDYGVRVFVRPTIPLGQYTGFLTAKQTALLSKPIEKTRVGMYVVEPWAWIKNIQEEIQVAYSMVESDAIGAGWLATLNKMHGVIVPNKFIYDVFTSCGVTKPLHVVNPSVDTVQFPFIDRSGKSVFTFGMAGYMDNRKSAREVIQAFISEFRGEKDVRLIIHSTNTDFGYYRGLKDPRITILTKPMTYNEMQLFYHSIDCYLAPSKGEGIGMTVLEAMSTGLPVIGTKWGGMTDILSEDRSYPLTEFSLAPRPEMIEQPGNWAYPDIQEIMYWMRHVFINQHEAQMRGQRASEYIKKYHNPIDVARELSVILQAYDESIV